LICVCDRQNSRVQVFKKDGSFVTKFAVEPLTAGVNAGQESLGR